MPLRDVAPLKVGRSADSGQPQTINDAPYNPASDPPPADPTDVALDVALDALAVVLDTSTTTKQRSDAAKAVSAMRAKRSPERTP